MQKFLTIVIVILAVVAFGILGTSLYGQYQLMATGEIAALQRFALLPGIAVSAGVLIAALTFVRERGKAEIEQRRHVSEVLLAQASEGFKTAIALLSDQNNSRVIWVRAARTLLQAKQLGRQINSEEYKIAYKLQEERARNDLYKILTLPDAKSNGRQPLPPQFFYGIDDWRTCQTLDDAAIRASENAVAYSVTIDSVPPQPHLRPLSVRSVVAIFSFVEYPKNYDDPLNDVPDWDENWDKSLFDIDQGARRYAAHKKQKMAVDGKLYDSSRNGN
jgi:hypothetical protein